MAGRCDGFGRTRRLRRPSWEAVAVDAAIPFRIGGRRFDRRGWSPDGSTLAIGYGFFCGGCGSTDARSAIDNMVEGLWVLHADSGVAEQPERCETGCYVTHPRWSADGSRIAYVLNSEQLRVWGGGENDAAAITVLERAGEIRDVSWSPDTTRIAVLDAAGRVSILGSDGSGETSSWTSSETITSLDWAPDGRSLAVTTRHRVGAIDLDDRGDLPPQPENRVLHDAADGTLGTVRWSPRGSLVAFDLTVRPSRMDGVAIPGHGEYWVAPADGGQPTRVFSSRGAVQYRTRPVWAPNGDALAFTISPRPPQASAETVVVSASGSTLSVVRHAALPLQFVPPPTWRPDHAESGDPHQPE